jgi:hypothetical protein
MSEAIEGMQFSFGGVAAATELELTMPGTIGIFDITKVEFGESKEKKAPYMRHVYTLKQILDPETKELKAAKPSSFNHDFYLNSAAVMARTQYLHKVMYGTEMTENANVAQLTAKFQGKEIALKVSGKVGDNGKGYPDLAFAGFAKKPEAVKELAFTAQEKGIIARAMAAIESGNLGNADKESKGSNASGPAPATMTSSGGF